MLDAAGDCALVVVLVAWFALTVTCQFRTRIAHSVRHHDLFGMIPDWRFFAPEPSTVDYHLLYRVVRPGGSASRWAEVPESHPRGSMSWLWNVGRRKRKALLDLCLMLANDAGSGNSRYITVSIPYLVLLRYVSELHHIDAEAVQFIIVEFDGRSASKSEKVFFLSTVHPL